MVDTPGLPGVPAGTVVVTFPAEVDMANAGSVGVELDTAFGPGVGMVIADMSGTKFCDSSGIHVLVMARKQARSGKTKFRVVAPHEEVRRVLEMVHLDTVLAIYPQLDMALVANDHKPADGQQGPPGEEQRRTLAGDGSADEGDVVA